VAEQGNGFEWMVSEDRLTVLLKVYAGTQSADDAKPEVSVDKIRACLGEKAIVAEVDTEAVEKELASPTGEWVTIARGIPPRPPTDARLEYLVDLDRFENPVLDQSSGRIDYKNLNLILNVHKGQELVRKHDPVPGEPGRDVYGEEISPKEPLNLDIPVGPGVEVTEDGHLAVATEDGAIASKRAKTSSGRDSHAEVFSESETTVRERRSVVRELSVTQTHNIRGDVSYKTGNVDFNGTVQITGNILSGFAVSAAQDIFVNGIVEGAHLEAGGSIVINGGIQGGGKAYLKAGESIRARFASEAKLEAGLEIVLQTHLLNCDSSAGEVIRLEGVRGVIAGGEARAGTRIESASMGTDLGVKTIVQIGLVTDLLQKISGQEEEIDALTKKLAEVQEMLMSLSSVKERVGSLTPDHEKLRIKGVQNQFHIMGELEQANKELKRLRDERERNRKGIITINGCAFTGVVVRFPGDVLTIDHEMKHLLFYFERGEVRTRAV